MSESEGESSTIHSSRSLSRSKRRKLRKVKSSSEESDSDEQEQPVSKKSRISRKCVSSDDDLHLTPIKCENIQKTPATRSSERLKVKNSKEFRVPTRNDVLDKVSPGVLKCPRSSERKLRELQPRRLINNFIRERNSYTADRSTDIYETDSELSDFIDDNEEDDDESEESESDQSLTASSHKDTSSAKRTSRKKNISSDSDSDDDFDNKSNRKRRKSIGVPEQKEENDVKPSKTSSEGKPTCRRMRTRKASIRKNKIVSDESSSYSTDENVPLSAFLNKTTNSLKKKKVISSSSEPESEVNTIEKGKGYSNKDEKSFTKIKDYPSRPRSTRRMKLNEKRQEHHSKTYGKLMKKRNEAKLSSKDPTLKKKKIETAVEMSEELKESQDKIEILKELIERCNQSDESDKEFVVNDEEVSDSEVLSDQEHDVKFLKIIDDYSQTTTDNDDRETLNPDPSGFSVQSRRRGKKLNNFSKWRRINTRVESGDSSDSESVREDYEQHNCQLHTAVNQNDIDLVKVILQQDPSSIFDEGYRKRSVLHLAALNGNIDMVKLLLKMNPDCEKLDKYGFPPIAYAANGNSECLEIFLRHTDMKQVNKRLLQTPSRMSLLHFAVGETRTGEKCSERGKCLELLFVDDKYHCSKMIEHRDARRRTPLEAAVYASQHQCVAILLKHGADPLSFRTKDRGNLLHFAVECASHLKHISENDLDTSLCLRQLVEPMALYLNETDTCGFTPLMYACETGNDECASVLIQAGAKVMTSDSYGTSPLHLAAMAGSTKCVNLLLSNGHSVDCVDNYGWPPLLYANFKAQEECVLALMKPKPKQLFVLGHLLKKQRNEEEKKKALKVVKNVLFSLANHDAYYTVFNDFIRVNPVLLDEYNHGLLQHTWRGILDFDNKQKWFKRKLNLLRSDIYCSSINLRVKRDDILGSTMQQIGQIHGKNLRSMSVVFENEPGICTGPKREFFACLSKDVVSPKRGLFEMSDDSQFSPTPNAYFIKYVSSHPTTLVTKQNSSPLDTKATVKTEDFSELMEDECTDSELLAADYSGNNDQSDDPTFSSVEEIDCTDSELVSAMETVTNSGFSESTASQTRSRTIPTVCGSSTTVSLSSTLSIPSGATDAPAPNATALNTERVIQEERSTGSPSNSQQGKEVPTKDKNTWISCLGKNGKDVVIHSIALRSKLKQLHLLGRLVGAAICQDMLLNLNLSKHFVKQVLGIPLCHPDDLSSFDYQLHQNMVTWTQENSVDDLELPFGVDAKNPWNDQLVPVHFSDDEDKIVDDSNKHEYIKLVSQHKLQTFIENEVEEFRIGLNEVIPRDLLTLFTADEFSLLMNGVMKIDVKDWKENTKYQGFTSNDEVITWFWDIVSRLKEEEKALLLKFSTGSPSVPIGGFASLQGMGGQNKFTITRLFDSNKIPQASTCFNMLKLTDYDNEKQLREKLLIAIRHGSEGFSFS